MSENYRELSDQAVTSMPEAKTPEPRPTEDYEMCKSCMNLMPLHGRCPFCGLSREDIDKTMWDKFKRSE